MESNVGNARRKALVSSVSCLLTEVGFDSAEKIALETLTEMLQSLITELGYSSHCYCELSGRTEPVIGDVVIALVNMGISLEGIESHARRQNRTTVQAPTSATQPKQLSILQAGVKQTPPSHVPDYFPVFPDPHAYIRTPTHKQPVTEYEAIREKSAIQKRDLERALTRFVAKTGEQHSLFLTPDNNNPFPLIPCKVGHPAYLNALLLKDQVFDYEEFEMRQNEFRKTKPVKTTELETIDNPYLRPVKMPKKGK
ncbi:transcription initiation factor TFIID subunit, putative [Pediculus humanus corporis]|uniref:Transcription initiation factor TFIID subunit 8 n=1 Tax=Pediculus humanus subsp. corporis TaxID=121224 RepID=E0VGZ1_PEDHC|nr:transcription initiation factor TFIID subunit, putative [Pediculus humanus corporis]EEB12647.1 transcription initiation factor TFIID subunit, putative [Pediculus humanus corporis]